MTKFKGGKVPVSERALLARINRVLKKDQEGIRRCKPDSRASTELGRYYRVDFFHNAIIGTHIDPEELGRGLKVLGAYEALDPGEG